MIRKQLGLIKDTLKNILIAHWKKCAINTHLISVTVLGDGPLFRRSILRHRELDLGHSLRIGLTPITTRP